MELTKAKILLVDDRPENLLTLEAVLDSPDYQLVKALSGEEALRLILREEFAVILLDVQMPGMSGFETAKLIRAREKSKEIPIIFVTALSQTPEHVADGYSVGAIDYIFKPFQPQILKSKVDGFAQMYHHREQIKRQSKILESLVQERTQELLSINQKLQKEIEDKEQMYRLLEESEQRYRQLVEGSPETILIRKLRSDRLMFVNQTGLKLFGAERKEELVGRSFFELIHPDDRQLAKSNQESLEKGVKLTPFQMRCLRMDGETIDVLVKIIPFIYQDQACVHVVLRDITELKKSQELIQQSEKLTVIGELAAGIAHEIRNPLTSLKGFVQLLDYSTSSSDHYMDIMLSEIERINSIVSELLLLAKPKAMDFDDAELRPLIANIVTLLSAHANLYGIEMETVYEPDHLDYYIRCEPNKIKQVFINILKNAMEAMPSGGRIEILVRSNGQDVTICFKDQGCGIPKDQLAKISSPFYTTKAEGTGLGLMVCQSIIENHQGLISMESEVGKGTTVTISLPVRSKCKNGTC